MKPIRYLFLFLVLLGWLFGQMLASGGQASQDNGITITWEDLQRILGLNVDQIKLSWAEFEKLLGQTGNRMDMRFDIKDGVVTLSREKFKTILNQMKPMVKKIPVPPRPYLFSQARYRGVNGGKQSRFSALLTVFVFAQETPAYINIPVLHASTAISGVNVDGYPVVVQTIGDWYQVSLNRNGYHEIELFFSVSHDNQFLSFPIVEAMINKIDFSVPQKEMLINIESLLNEKYENSANASKISGNLPSTRQFTIKWQLRGKTTEKKPALFYAETNSLLSVEADLLKVRTIVDLEVLQSSLDQISLLIPRQYEVIKIDQFSNNNWQVRDTSIGRVLEINLGYDVAGKTSLAVNLERTISSDTLSVDFSGLEVVDARREAGNMGVVAESAVEVDVKGDKNLEKREFHQLSPKILSMSSRPILYCYKYSQHPFQLNIDIHKYERVEGISTVIESAQSTVMFLEEGKVLSKTIYSIRNSYKQFMELELPESARVWTVMVDQKAEKSSRNKQGKILIPLVRSTGNGDQLRSFKVELLYSIPFKEFGLKGSFTCMLPRSDIFINKADLEVYLPEGFHYSFNKGEWKEKPMTTPKKSKIRTTEITARKEQASSLSEQIVVYGEKPTVQVPPGVVAGIEKGRWNIDGMVTDLRGPVGLNSVDVYLPLSGIKYAFTKNVIDKNEMYPLEFSYTDLLVRKGIFSLILLVVFAGLVFFTVKKIRIGKK